MDVFALLQATLPDVADLRTKYRAFGLDRALQYFSGVVLYRYGLELDKAAKRRAAAALTPTSRAAAQKEPPAGLPQKRQRGGGRAAPPTPLPAAGEATHELVDTWKNPKALPKAYEHNRPVEWWQYGGHCRACTDLAQRTGYIVGSSGRDVKRSSEVRHLPDVLPPAFARAGHLEPGQAVPRIRTACKQCSTTESVAWLCPDCHNKHNGIWDHVGRRPVGERFKVG